MERPPAWPSRLYERIYCILQSSSDYYIQWHSAKFTKTLHSVNAQEDSLILWWCCVYIVSILNIHFFQFIDMFHCWSSCLLLSSTCGRIPATQRASHWVTLLWAVTSLEWGTAPVSKGVWSEDPSKPNIATSRSHVQSGEEPTDNYPPSPHTLPFTVLRYFMRLHMNAREDT